MKLLFSFALFAFLAIVAVAEHDYYGEESERNDYGREMPGEEEHDYEREMSGRKGFKLPIRGLKKVASTAAQGFAGGIASGVGEGIGGLIAASMQNKTSRAAMDNPRIDRNIRYMVKTSNISLSSSSVLGDSKATAYTKERYWQKPGHVVFV